MSNNAPICVIDPIISTQQPAAKILPSIPPATDLASALAAISALTAAVNTMLGRTAVPTNKGGGFNVIDPTSKKAKPQPRFNESSRVTEVLRIYNPDDKAQFVDVQQIKQLTMRDSVTGEQWVWNR